MNSAVVVILDRVTRSFDLEQSDHRGNSVYQFERADTIPRVIAIDHATPQSSSYAPQLGAPSEPHRHCPSPKHYGQFADRLIS